MKKKLLAWCLTAAMVVTGLNLSGSVLSGADSAQASWNSAVTVQAATNDFGTTRDYSSGVTAALTNQEAPTNDWSGFDLTLTNNSGGTICDWIVVMQVPSGAASVFKCWNATFVEEGDTIYLYPMRTGANAVVSAGTLTNDVPGGGFMGKYVDASSIQVKAVYYNKGTQSAYDYSTGKTNDENSGGGSGGSSSVTDSETNKDLVVEYNYAKLLQESLYFYDANMCGTQVSENCGLSWRRDCHTEDANLTCSINGTNYSLDVSGGFHDAGDHVKFGLPQGYAASMLGMSYYQSKAAYDSLGQTAHLQKITDYFCDYFKRCTVYQDNAARSGGVVAFCYQVGDGNADHGYWGAPENQTGSRPAYFATASNPATDEVSVAIAALALNYINFHDAEDLQVAKDLFSFVQKNSKSCATEGAGSFYLSNSWQDDYAVAAAALYVATGDASYQTEYNSNKSEINTGWLLDWANTGALGAMLMGDWSILSQITNTKSNGTVLDGVFACINDWGSCRYNAALQFCGLVYDKGTGTSTYTSWAKDQMEYILGNNPNKRCYVVGYNENASKYPHHRAASRSTDASQVRADHYTLLGALVGGPKTSGYYKDDQADYNCNEVALDYSAGLVGAAAELYLACKGSTEDNYKEGLASQEELSSIGVTTYYGVEGQVITSPTPGQTSQPGQTGTPGQTETPGQTSQPGQTETPGQSGQPNPTATPGQSGQPGQTVAPGQTAAPGQSGNSGLEAASGNTAALKKPTIRKVAAGRKKLTVTWKKVSRAQGYQLAVSTSKKMGKAKKYTVKGSKTKKGIKKLSARKKYYVKVRAWKKVNGKKVYGGWSKVKTKKTK